jgi:predicted NBD/HSP70 family sugar kinase
MDQAEVRNLASGRNQQGVRDYNERLILSTIQRRGPLAGSDIARQAGLSPQTISVILRKLESDQLIRRGDPQRGRVGKPSIPMDLDPDGAYSVGLKIGRRSADLVLVDFCGRVRQQMQTTYRYPMPGPVLGFLKSGLRMIEDSLTPASVARIAGIGIALPSEIWSWHDIIGAPQDQIVAWKDFDLAGEIAGFSDWPVVIENDATAACRAEHIYGRGREFANYAYIFIGSFIGGGVVLNHSVYEGGLGNAGAIGPLPVVAEDGAGVQLIDAASLYPLEGELTRAGFDPARIWSQPQDWSEFPALLDGWISRTARHLARAALTVCAVIDFEAVVIDGAFPPDVRRRLVAETSAALDGMDRRGVITPQIAAGTVGHNARALGAASIPIIAQYLLNTHSVAMS